MCSEDQHDTVPLDKSGHIAKGTSQRQYLSVHLADSEDIGIATLEETALTVDGQQITVVSLLNGGEPLSHAISTVTVQCKGTIA